jgi:hypothetical protein
MLIVVDLGIRDLERDVPIVLEIVSEVDGRHAAGAGSLLDAVAVRKDGLEAVKLFCHEGLRYGSVTVVARGASAFSRWAEARARPLRDVS